MSNNQAPRQGSGKDTIVPVGLKKSIRLPQALARLVSPPGASQSSGGSVTVAQAPPPAKVSSYTTPPPKSALVSTKNSPLAKDGSKKRTNLADSSDPKKKRKVGELEAQSQPLPKKDPSTKVVVAKSQGATDSAKGGGSKEKGEEGQTNAQGRLPLKEDLPATTAAGGSDAGISTARPAEGAAVSHGLETTSSRPEASEAKVSSDHAVDAVAGEEQVPLTMAGKESSSSRGGVIHDLLAQDISKVISVANHNLAVPNAYIELLNSINELPGLIKRKASDILSEVEVAAKVAENHAKSYTGRLNRELAEVKRQADAEVERRARELSEVAFVDLQKAEDRANHLATDLSIEKSRAEACQANLSALYKEKTTRENKLSQEISHMRRWERETLAAKERAFAEVSCFRDVTLRVNEYLGRRPEREKAMEALYKTQGALECLQVLREGRDADEYRRALRETEIDQLSALTEARKGQLEVCDLVVTVDDIRMRCDALAEEEEEEDGEGESAEGENEQVEDEEA